MPDALLLTCCDHTRTLVPLPGDGSVLACPAPLCCTAVRITALPASPLTSLEQESVTRNEFVAAHQKAGFSRAEAMQILCCVIQAAVMKGPAGG